MKTVTLEVRSLADTLNDAVLAMESGAENEAGKRAGSAPRIAFESPELLWKVLTAKRWELLRALTGAGPVTLREAARRVARDVKAVHGDAHALLDAGILERTTDGKIVFPFDAVHVDFMLRAA
ncbi:MAG: DNA-binding protein [Candidatus Accumulibacter sp.]|jgi:predicted transcriptional regulator|nr:DNA-binding protein [Accumulibacter sp.]